MKCQLCDRQTMRRLCAHHEEARRNLEKAYEVWVDAYGSIGWNTYLDRVIMNDQTGQWAKEVAMLLRRELNDKRTV